MSDEQNIEEQPTDDSPQSTEDNSQPLTDSQLQTTNYQPQTTNMEVHKHPHHVTHKKKWTEYLLEFLMLFLAVFLGFVAENIREGVVETHREKQFIKSLLNDLRLDTVWLNTVTESANVRIQNIDSAILSLSASENTEMPVSVYQHLRKSTVQIMFFPNDGTITQLKSSGGMRLITNRKTVDSIEDYDRLMRRLEVRRGITNELTHDFTEALNKTVIGNDLLHTLYDSLFYKKKIIQKQTIRLNDQNLNVLINECVSVRLRAVSDTNTNGSVKRSASNLIKFLKKEYHLEYE